MITRLAFASAVVLAPLMPTLADTVVYREGDPNAFVATPYAGTSDTTLLGNSDTNSNAHFGANEKLYVGIHDRARRSLLRFDLSSLHGQYSTITGATLTLTVDQATHAGTLDVFQLVDGNAGWVEGTGGALGSVSDAQPGEATWHNLAHPGTPWVGGTGIGSAGYGASPLDSEAFPQQAGGVTTPATLEVTLPASLIDAWVTGANAGLLLRHASDGVVSERQLLQLRSSEWATPSSRPTLTIEFEPIPEPASVGLLLSGLALVAGRGARR